MLLSGGGEYEYTWSHRGGINVAMSPASVTHRGYTGRNWCLKAAEVSVRHRFGSVWRNLRAYMNRTWPAPVPMTSTSVPRC